MTSSKQRELIELYRQMARDGITRKSGPGTFSVMNIRLFKDHALPLFKEHSIATVLDYGCGQTSWDEPSFAEGMSAREFFGVTKACRFEPSLGIDEREICDAVTCFDVLEHIFVTDVSSIVAELFSLARRLVIVNVACYPASAHLPNGENAHITVRPPPWWKGIFDAVAPDYPQVTYLLYASTRYGEAISYAPTSCARVIDSVGYTRDIE